MKLLVFAHSGSAGGAQNALRHMVGLLRMRHDIHIVLPSVDGGEALYYQSLGLNCYHLPIGFILPDFSGGLLQYSRTDFLGISGTLRRIGFDAVISNTVVALHGAILARSMELPHLLYVHEYLDGDEWIPTSIATESYLRIIEQSSSSIICCSRFVASQFNPDSLARLPVLEPYDYREPPVPRQVNADAELVVQLIGTQSLRKNPAFAVTLVKSLEIRRLRIRLDIIGEEGTGSARLRRSLAKRGVSHRILPHQSDPYQLNLCAKVVTLVCSDTEPYGLTIPESLRQGIPVLATRSGGPEAMLPPEYIFNPGDLEQAVRALERIFEQYGNEIPKAFDLYASLQASASRHDLETQLDAVLTELVAKGPKNGRSRLNDLLDSVRRLIQIPVGIDSIANSISEVSAEIGERLAPEAVRALIEAEAQSPGMSVRHDVLAHDVVPFAMSPAMDALYKYGTGLAVELASTFNDPGRFQMSVFIACRLDEYRMTLGRIPKVLALGDGIGIDAIRLAAAGFDVDYIDYDKSNMSRIASINIDLARNIIKPQPELRIIERADSIYDAVICLEVIEHVPSPDDFVSALHGYLKEDGLLFVSECFNGIDDRWPTHLYKNERFAGMLPFLLFERFRMTGVNRQPYGKPYVFKKRKSGDISGLMELLLDRNTMAAMLNNQLDIGI